LWRRRYFPVQESSIAAAAFGNSALWKMTNDERRTYNTFVKLRQFCDPTLEPRRELLPSLAEEAEERERAAAAREARPMRWDVEEHRGVSMGGEGAFVKQHHLARYIEGDGNSDDDQGHFETSPPFRKYRDAAEDVLLERERPQTPAARDEWARQLNEHK